MEVTHFLEALWQLSAAMAPYILFGLFFAGVMHELVPESIVTKHLGKDNVSSVVKATLFGIPLPVCSCGVMPLATAIKKSGASKGATLSFLISTPITGIDSIMATYGIFGWIFTLYRVLTSMTVAIVAGVLTNIFDDKSNAGIAALGSNFSALAPVTSDVFSTPKLSAPTNFAAKETSCCSGTDKEDTRFSLLSATRYAFVTLLGDIAKPLFWGLMLGALITVAIPNNLSSIIQGATWLSYLIAIFIAVPMYVCATASLPIAAGLMLSGISAGAAFVFLTAGPATNTVTIGVVKKMLGSKSLAIYLGSITIGSILFGLGLDYIFDVSSVDPTSLIDIKEDGGWTTTISAAILWILLLWFIGKSYLSKSKGCNSDSCCT